MNFADIFRKSLNSSYGIKEYNIHFKSEKADKEKGIIYGVFAKANVLDAQNEIITNQALEESAHNYLMNINRISLVKGGYPGYTHKIAIDAHVVESYIDKSSPEWAWKGAIKVFDPKIKKEIREGRITGFSVGGYKLVKPIGR